jgi:putative transcriptional regulator
MIKIRLAQLMREKQAEWQRNITYDDIVEATGISKTTLVRMAKERNQRVDLDVLDKLCGYFGCNVADILVRVQDDEFAKVTAGRG